MVVLNLRADGSMSPKYTMSRANAVDEDFKVSLEEKSIIEASRHLNVSGLNELKDYIKLLIIKQNIDKDAKK